MVEMLEPIKGCIYDPCCGSCGMFVQSEKFVAARGGMLGDIAIYGQEMNGNTWLMAKMNFAVRGIDADIRWNTVGTFHKSNWQTCGLISSLQTRPSTFPTGAVIGCASMPTGNTASRPMATPRQISEDDFLTWTRTTM